MCKLVAFFKVTFTLRIIIYEHFCFFYKTLIIIIVI